jgi:Big-like domain-containing protein
MGERMLRHRFIARALTTLAAVGTSLAIGVTAASAADTTTTTVAASPTAVWGQSVALAATVSDTTTPATVPTGSVQFSDGATAIGSAVPLAGGAASLATATLSVGAHAITATYTPDDLSAFTGSTGPDPGASVMVAKAATTTTLGAAPNPTVAGQNATFSAAVAAAPPGAGSPSGSVQFADHGGPTFDTVGLDAMGHASTVAYAFAGLYTVDANYVGDAHFNPSTGSVQTQVNRAATSTALTISPNPATPGATITFSAVVGSVPPGDVAPAGSLQFSIDAAPIGAAIGLGNGAIGYQGTLTAPPGNRTYQVAVSYSGDADTEPSSASVPVTVAAPTTVSAPSSTVTVAVAQLKAMVSTLTTALRLRGFAALTSTTQTLRAGPGVVEQKVYSPNAPRAARSAAAKKPIVLASARHRFATAGTGTLRLKLTNAGRRAIRHAKSLKLAIVTRYTPTGGKAVVATQRLTVRAKGKRKAARAATAGGWRLAGTAVSR